MFLSLFSNPLNEPAWFCMTAWLKNCMRWAVDGLNIQATKSAIFPSTVSMLRTESAATLFYTCSVYVVPVLLPLTHRRVVRIGKALVYSLPHEDPGIIFERAFDNLVIVLLQVLRHLRRKSKDDNVAQRHCNNACFARDALESQPPPEIIFSGHISGKGRVPELLWPLQVIHVTCCCHSNIRSPHKSC